MFKTQPKGPFLDQQIVSQIKPLIEAAKTVIVLLPPDPSNDQIAAALGLSLTLESLGKSVQVGSSSPIKVDAAEYFGVDKIKTTIGNQNLIVSFKFREEDLKKVDYDIDSNGRFQLLIQPQPGIQPPDSSTIEFSYSGADADLVFVIGVLTLEELGAIYAQEKAFLDKAKIISLNLTAKTAQFDCLALHNQMAASLAELTTILLKQLELSPSPDAATNLLSAVSNATQRFQSPRTQAETFESAAYLMHAGGTLGGSSFATSSRFGAFPPAFPTFPAPTFGDEDEEALEALPPLKPNRGAPKDWKQPKIFKPSSDTSSR